MDELKPAPTVQNISIVDHIFTVAHDPSVSASSISDLLELASYEVFDIILDPASNETPPPFPRLQESLDTSVQRWDPVRSDIEDSARMAHNTHCQMCAAFSTTKSVADQEVTAVSNSLDDVPSYITILSINGMTCSSCVSNITRALRDVPSVLQAEVALVSNSAKVHFHETEPEATAQKLVEAVEAVGYEAEVFELQPALSPRQEQGETADLWQAAYAIEGMSCTSCVGKITGALKQLWFVQRVDINLAAHSGTVVFQGKNNEALVAAAIRDCGYKAEGIGIESLVKQDSDASRIVSIRIGGVRCPQCPRRIQAALKQLPVHVQKGVTVDDPILTVTYTPDAPAFTVRTIMSVISSVDASFVISLHKPQSIEERSRTMLARERRAILRRVFLSVTTAIPTLIIGVIYMNLVSQDDGGYVYLMHPLNGVSRAEWASFIMATPVYFYGADHFHRRTIREVYALWRPRSSVSISKRFYRFGSMNMLISLGTSIAYFASLAQLIVAASSRSMGMTQGFKQSYFDSVVFLTMFLLLGRLAEAHMKAKSGDAVAALGRLRPTQANLLTGPSNEYDTSVEKVDVDLIDRGDVVRVLHGSSPAADGTLLDRTATFDESSLTGESQVIRKKTGDVIYSGTINKGSAISMRVTGPAGASMLDSIIQVVREGQAKRAPMERVADLLTAYFVPVVISIAVATWIIWLALGLSGVLPESYLDVEFGGWSFWSLQFAIAVFVIACPCGLGLAAPTALYVGGGMAATRGILVKGGGEAFQEASKLDAVVFDKTGTLTEGVEPKIVEHRIFDGGGQLEGATILGMLKGIESNSSHPLAKAAVDFAISYSAAPVRVLSSDDIAGKGLKASCVISSGQRQGEQHEALVGNESLMDEYDVPVPQEARALLESWKSSACSVILLAWHIHATWELIAIFAASDPLRPESAEVVRALQSQQVDVWMLSGDNPSTARAVGLQVGISPDNILAGVLPAQKAEKVKYLQQTVQKKRRRGLLDSMASQRRRATVAMIGDGINDAPALAAADVGIAVASGSDVAVQSAAFVLVHSDLRAVLDLVTLSRAVFRRVILNFFWAAIYNIIALPVAAGVLYPLRTGGGSHVRLDPAWAALAMALSSLTVVGSSLLLRSKLPVLGFQGRRTASYKEA